MRYLFNAAQAQTDRWTRRGTAPPASGRIQDDIAGRTVTDQHGNALGGVRISLLDVPTATYYPTSAPASTCGSRATAYRSTQHG